jgi:hypothetical protein
MSPMLDGPKYPRGDFGGRIASTLGKKRDFWQPRGGFTREGGIVPRIGLAS